jgi:hypothetical protein
MLLVSRPQIRNLLSFKRRHAYHTHRFTYKISGIADASYFNDDYREKGSLGKKREDERFAGGIAPLSDSGVAGAQVRSTYTNNALMRMTSLIRKIYFWERYPLIFRQC